MKVRIPNAMNSQKCPKCQKLMRSQWFGYKCTRCGYEQLNKIGREFNEDFKMEETIDYDYTKSMESDEVILTEGK